MANLILTQKCNKNCSYCFAREFRQDIAVQNEMSLDLVSSILDKVLIDNPNNARISLLGGEPTEHSQFEEILLLCFSRNVSVNLISNFLFSPEIRETLLRCLREKKNISFLVNATELRSRISIFAENYNTIHPIAGENALSCGLTFDGELLTPGGFDSYISFLQDHLDSIDKLRLSLNFPGSSENKGDYYFINNLKLGDLVYHAVRRCLFIGASPAIDCITFPCMYRSNKIKKFIQQYDSSHHGCICSSPPEDYFPDGSVKYCFPFMKSSLDSSKYRSDKLIVLALRNSYQAAQRFISPPPECSSCQFFKNKECQGPCMGFIK